MRYEILALCPVGSGKFEFTGIGNNLLPHIIFIIPGAFLAQSNSEFGKEKTHCRISQHFEYPTLFSIWPRM